MVEVSKRQKIRKTILLISVFLFPVIYYYLSPYLIIAGASEGVVTGSFLLFGTMFLTSLFIGRAFCGWICPAGREQDLLYDFRNKRFFGGRLDWLKYFIWFPWLSIIGLMFVRAGGFKSFDFLYQTYYGISVYNIGSAVLFLIIAGTIALLAFALGRRGFCHAGCWMAPFMITGRKVGNRLRFPGLRLKAQTARCAKCEVCTKNCPMSLDVMKMVQKEEMENSECILCGTCIDICPNKVIKYSFSRSVNK